MELYILVGSMFLTITFITGFILYAWMQKKNSVTQKLKDINTLSSKPQQQKQPFVFNQKEKSSSKQKLSPSLEKVIVNISKVYKNDEKRITKAQKALLNAGYRNEKHVKIYLGSKVLGLILLPSFYLYLTLVVSSQVPEKFGMMLLIITIVGYSFPDLILNSRIRKRQEDIGSSLADALDLLVTCVEAGMGLNASILKVGEELELRCKPLSEELLLVNQEMRTGVTREVALRNLSFRNKNDDLNIIVGALVMADRLGSSIGQTLRTHADSLRTRIRQRIEEQAAKAGIKMLFPLVFFILPALLIVMLGPGIIQLVRSLSDVN